MIAEAFEDTAHDTVLARMNLDAYLLLVGRRSIFDSVSLDFTIIEGDTVSNLLHIVSCHVLVEKYVVNLLLQELRVSELTCEVTIVSEKEYAGSVAVETSYRVDALRASVLYEVHYDLALLWVISSGDIVLWLVEENVNFLLKSYRLIVETNLVSAENLCSEFGNDLSINGYYACFDEIISLTT